ncbi:MAG: DUF1127 domain-containing protein [Paracoccaceae bacterium]|nr:DUF1127 domain-containing protein [Paracoccaceae bacterium]
MSIRTRSITLPSVPSVSLTGLFALVSLIDSTFRQRQTLKSLDDHLLKDLGLTREMAEAEAGRPVWDVPARWRR